MHYLFGGGLALESEKRAGIFSEIQQDGGPAVQRCLSDAAVSTTKGRVKWFDSTKGYGFVTPDDGSEDILIHCNLLAPLGCKALPEGTGIEVRTREGARGRQGTLILQLDFQTSIFRERLEATASQYRPPERAGERAGERTGEQANEPLDISASDGNFETTEVLWFNRARGYGFLLRDDGVTQIFIHMETIRAIGLGNLFPGQSLLARIDDGPRGLFAAEIRL